MHYTTGPCTKDVIFTIGISDYDTAKDKRIIGNDHIYVQTAQDRWETSVRVAETAVDLWEENFKNLPSRPMPARQCPMPTVASDRFDGAT